MIKKILKIEGMHCSSCAFLIDGDLEDLEGVETAKTSFAKSECKVEFDDAKLTLAEIISAVSKTGYAAKI